MIGLALKVGELYASMRLDNSQFDKGLDESGKRFGNLRSMIESGVKTGARLFAGATTAAAGLGIAAFKVGKDFNVLQQNSRAALTTILGSAEAAADQMDRLDEFANTSPFARQVWITAQQQLLGFGVEAERVVPILDSVQQAVAAVGGGNEEIERITYSLAQMQGTGRLTGETLNRLGQYGIDAATIIGAEMGKTGEEIRAMASQPGGIPVDDIWDPLVDGLMASFDGATDGLRRQWDGAVDRVKAAWRDIGAILAAPFIDPMGGGRAVDWANDFADTLRAAQAKIKPFVDILVDRLAPGMDALTPMFERAQGAINSWDVSKVNSQLDELGRYAPLIAGTSAALFALGTTNLPILSSLGFTGINPVVAGLAALVAASPDARAALRDVGNAASPLLDVVKTLGVELSDTLMHALDELIPAAGALATAFVDAGVPLVQSLTPALVGLLDASRPLIEIVADLAQWVAELPTPVLLAATAFGLMMGPLRPIADGLAGVATGFVRIIQQARVQAVLGETNIAMGGLARASATARPAIEGVGTALKGAFMSNALLLGIGALVGALAAFAAKQAEVRAAADSYKQTLDEMGNVTEETTDRIIEEITRIKNENYLEALFGSGKSALERAEEIGVASDLVIGYIKGEERAVEELIAITDAYIEANSGSRRERREAEERVRRFISAIDDEADALAMGIDAKERSAEASGRLKDSEDVATDAVRRQIDALRDQHDALLEGANASIGQSRALRRQEESQDRTRDALKRLTDVSKDAEATEKDVEDARRAVEAALDDEAAAHIDLLGAMERNNAEGAEMRSVTLAARDAFIESAKQMGHTADEAEALADKYGLIPEKIFTQVELETAQAKWALDEFIRTSSGRVIRVRTELGSGVTTYDYGGGMVARADGGLDEAGRHVPRVPQMVQGGRNVLWGEDETVWESYISGKPSARTRNLAVMEETARRLGGLFVRPMADGGVTRPSVDSGRGAAVPVSGGLSERDVLRIAAAVREGAAAGSQSGVSAGFVGLSSGARLSGVVV